MNTPIQGTSADIIKIAMLNLHKARDEKAWEGHILVQVHDELLFELKPEALSKAQVQIRKLMENALPLSVPVLVDFKSGNNWTEMSVIK